MLAPIRIVAEVDHLGCWSAWVAPCPVSASVGPSPAAALQRLCEGLRVGASAVGTDRARSGTGRYEFVIGDGTVDCDSCAASRTSGQDSSSAYCGICGGTGRVCKRDARLSRATGPGRSGQGMRRAT